MGPTSTQLIIGLSSIGVGVFCLLCLFPGTPIESMTVVGALGCLFIAFLALGFSVIAGLGALIAILAFIAAIIITGLVFFVTFVL